MRLKLSNLYNSVVQQYNLKVKETSDRYVYMVIRRRMYGLLQAWIIAQKILQKRLNKQGYQKSDITPELWTHDWRLICCSLCVDDFSVKYAVKQHVEHLMAVIQDHYKISSDWKEKKLRSGSRLGLRQTHSAPFNARVCGRIPHHITPKISLQATG